MGSVPPCVVGELLKLAQFFLCTNKTSHFSYCHFYEEVTCCVSTKI